MRRIPGYGTVQEDAYGNYNFQSSEVVEYTVSPNDPGFLTPTKTTAINIAVPAQFPNRNPAVTSYTYTPPAGHNGYWLLTVSRYSLATYPYSCTPGSTSSDGHTIYIPNCGTFYPTGSSDSATSQNASTQLANDLGNINSWQLAFLTTVGQAAYGGSNNSTWNVAGWTGYGATTNGFTAFSNALDALNGSSQLTQSLLSPTSAYTLVTSNGIGGRHHLRGQLERGAGADGRGGDDSRVKAGAGAADDAGNDELAEHPVDDQRPVISCRVSSHVMNTASAALMAQSGSPFLRSNRKPGN